MKPTQEQVIAWAREIATQCAKQGVSTWTFEYAMTRIMELRTLAYEAGAAAEREACAQICDEQMEWGEINKSMAVAAGNCADLIRERGEQ